MKILVVEDEPIINKSITDYLVSQQYVVESVFTFADALEKVEMYEYDCIVLDLMLSDGSGFNLLQELKQNKKAEGVIILSARDELEDKLKGLQLGADDYLTKPFHLSELGMRIAAIIRRKSFAGNQVIEAGDLVIYPDDKAASANGKDLALTKKEFDLLLYFVINKKRVLSKNAIAEHLWGDDMDLADNYDFVYTHIKNLRRKLESAGCGGYLKSVYGMGYKFSAT